MFWKSIYKLTYILIILINTSFTVFSQPINKSTDIYTTVSFEQYFSNKNNKKTITTSPTYEGFWLYSSLPKIKIAKKKIFTAIEIDLLNKDLYLNNHKLNEGFFQRYGLFIGTGIIKSEKQKSIIYLGGGLASDFLKIEKKCGYFTLFMITIGLFQID